MKRDDLAAKINPLNTLLADLTDSQSKFITGKNTGKLKSINYVVMASISQFNVLLNNLSNELSSENLQSLIYVCGELISERESEKISSGWDAFKILIRRNAIGEKPMKMAFLLGIIKELRPQRKDLVNMVKRYIEDHYREPQKIMDGYENSSDH